MTHAFKIGGIVIVMHLLGTAVLFGYISGVQTMFFAPLLGLFGWFFIFPEIIGVCLQWILYEPYPKPSKTKVLVLAVISTLIGGCIVALCTPKEYGNEAEFWIAGFLAGSVAALFSFVCIHLIKSSEYKKISEQVSVGNL